jgi:hypothetical protein
MKKNSDIDPDDENEHPVIKRICKPVSPIDSYSDDTIRDWLDEFNANPNDPFIDGCPFSYYEVRREYLHRKNLRDAIEDLNSKPD